LPRSSWAPPSSYYCRARPRPLPRRLQYGLAWAAIGLTALNALTTFLQCGPLECPDNPGNYWAFARE